MPSGSETNGFEVAWKHTFKIRPDALQMNDSVRLNWCGAVEGVSLPSSSCLCSFQPWPFAFPRPLTFNCLRSVFPFPLSHVQTWQSVAVGCRGGHQSQLWLRSLEDSLLLWRLSWPVTAFARERDWAQCRNHHAQPPRGTCWGVTC